MKSSRFHDPPFKTQVLAYAEVAKNGHLFDLYGGDASYGVILLNAYSNLNYWYFDIDDEALETARNRLEEFGSRAHIKKFNARYLDKRISEEGLREIDCAIYDPGLRRGHVENPERGFLSKFSGPLDARYDRTKGKTIADVVNGYNTLALAEIFRTVEMPYPRRVANAIVRYRDSNRITTTEELSRIVSRVFPSKARRKRVSPEVLAMLALRIHVNEELEALGEAVKKGFEALRVGGLLITISYHSGEARIYKEHARKFDKRYAQEEKDQKLRVVTKKALKPSDEEINQNPLIRSAQMRVYEKIKS